MHEHIFSSSCSQIILRQSDAGDPKERRDRAPGFNVKPYRLTCANINTKDCRVGDLEDGDGSIR